MSIRILRVSFFALMNHWFFNHKFGIFTIKSHASSLSPINLFRKFFHCLQLEHSKAYKNDMEEKFRMKIFLENKNKIAQHNQRYHKGEVSFKLGLNKYADLLHHEFVAHMNGFNRSTELKWGILNSFLWEIPFYVKCKQFLQ